MPGTPFDYAALAYNGVRLRGPAADGSQYAVMQTNGSGVMSLGQVNLASANAVTGLLPAANVALATLSEVWVDTPSGYGSTNNKIRIYTVTNVNTGSAITYATSAAAGASFTINETGDYWIQRLDGHSAATSFCISVNSNQLTTDWFSITKAHLLPAFGDTTSASQKPEISCIVRLTAADVVRPHDTATGCTGSNFASHFRIRKLH